MVTFCAVFCFCIVTVAVIVAEYCPQRADVGSKTSSHGNQLIDNIKII